MKPIKTAGQPPMPASYRRLCAQLGRTGWIALGSVLERKVPRGGGPRYQWSRRVEGKTISVALSYEQFLWLKAAITNQRQIETLIRRMHRLTLASMWKSLPSTTRRKRLGKKTLGLN